LLVLYQDITEQPDAPAALFRIVVAMGEHIVKGLRLRDDPEAARAELAKLIGGGPVSRLSVNRVRGDLLTQPLASDELKVRLQAELEALARFSTYRRAAV
jgi:hypothetical protein